MWSIFVQLSQTDSMDKLNAELKQHNAMNLLEEDLSRKLLAKMRYFKHFEEDGTLDWFFHPDLCRIEALDDYQRLVLRNHVSVYIVSVFNYEMTVSTIRCCLLIWFCDRFSFFSCHKWWKFISGISMWSNFTKSRSMFIYLRIQILDQFTNV